jgi:hypothetical protein
MSRALVPPQRTGVLLDRAGVLFDRAGVLLDRGEAA